MLPVQIQINDQSKIISQKIFIANKIAPLAIQKDKINQNRYKLLFKMEENINEKVIYLEVTLEAEDSLDKSYIESKSIYIDNIMKNENKYKAFKELMRDYNENLFYFGDLNIIRKEMNYTIDSFKTISNGKDIFYESNKIYIPRYMYIILSLYKQELLDPYNDMEKEFLFVTNDLINIKFEKAESVKLVASTKKQLDNGDFLYSTMYDLICGPSSWKFTYEVITADDYELKEPLFSYIYNAEYSQYNNRYIGTVSDRGFVYVIVKNDQDKIVAINVSNELIEKTNLIDPYFIFIEEEDRENV